MDKDQIGVFTKKELELIKLTFAENDTLLYTIRKVLLQFPLTETEKGLIKLSVTEPILKILKKKMLPEMSPDFPLGQIPNLLASLTMDLQNKDVQDMELRFEAKRLEIEYLTQQFNVIKGIERFPSTDIPQTIKLVEMEKMAIGDDPRECFVNATAFLFLMGFIDAKLNEIKVLAGIKEETAEEQEKRLGLDSSQ